MEPTKSRLVRALYDFKPTGGGSKLAIHCGDTIHVIDSSHSDWWLGYIVSNDPSSESRNEGYFPSSYVEEVMVDPQSKDEETKLDSLPENNDEPAESQEKDTVAAEGSVSPVEAWFPEYCLHVESSKLMQLPSKAVSSKYKNVIVPVYRLSTLERAVKTDTTVRYAGSVIYCTLEDVLNFDAQLCEKFPDIFGTPVFSDNTALQCLISRSPVSSSAPFSSKLGTMDITGIHSKLPIHELFPFCKDIYRFMNPSSPITRDVYLSLPVSLPELRAELKALASKQAASSVPPSIPTTIPSSAELERIRHLLQAYFAHLLVAAHHANLPASLFPSPPSTHTPYAEIPPHTAASIWSCFRAFFLTSTTEIANDSAMANISTRLTPIFHSDVSLSFIGKGVQYSVTVHPPLSRLPPDADDNYAVNTHPLEPVLVGMALSARATTETENKFWDTFWTRLNEEHERKEREALEAQQPRGRMDTYDSFAHSRLSSSIDSDFPTSFGRNPSYAFPQTPLSSPAFPSRLGAPPPSLSSVPSVDSYCGISGEDDEIAAFERMMGIEPAAAESNDSSDPRTTAPATATAPGGGPSHAHSDAQYAEVDAFIANAPALRVEYEQGEKFTPGAHFEFGLEDMDAFDALLESHWAVVFDEDGISLRPAAGAADPAPGSSWRLCVPGNKASSPDSEPSMLIINPLSTLVISFFTLLWDGAASNATAVEKALTCNFTLGDFRNTDALPIGVHQALYSLVHQGQSLLSDTPFVLILAPSLAYGETGRDAASNRLAIPQNVHLVYLLSIHSSTASPKASLIPDFAAYCRHRSTPSETRLGFQPSAKDKKNMLGSKSAPGGTNPIAAASLPTASNASNAAANAMKRASSVPFLPPAPPTTPNFGALPTPGSAAASSRASRGFRSSVSNSSLYGPIPVPGGGPSRLDSGRDKIDTLNPALVQGSDLSSGQKKMDPESAERAFREYLSTLKQPGDEDAPKGKKKSLRKLIKSAFVKKNTG